MDVPITDPRKPLGQTIRNRREALGLTQEQLADNLKTTDWQMLPEEVVQLDKISKPAPVYPYMFLEHTAD